MGKLNESLKIRGSRGLILSVGALGVMIALAVSQLMGTLWFQQAIAAGDGQRIRPDFMGRALRIQPFHSFYWFSIGREYQNQSTKSGLTLMERRRLLNKARIYLEKAISLEPSASLYHYHLGWVYGALGPHRPQLKTKTQRAFSRAISLNPTNADIRWGVANYYLGQYALFLKTDGATPSEAEADWVRRNVQRHFRAFLEIEPPQELNRVLDTSFAVTQRYDDLKGVIPDQAEYHLRLAQFLNQKGMWESAKKEFQIAISQDPINADVYHVYGSALFAHKDHEAALAVWKKAQEISLHNPRSYLALSNALWILNRKEESVAELERLVDIQSDETSYRLALAARLEGTGNGEKALEVYANALSKDPDNPEIYAHLARYWERQKNFSEAEAALVKAISLKPSAIIYRDRLAWLFFKQKRYSRAIQEWHDLLNQDPKSLRALKGIASSYEELGALDRALGYYREALSIRPGDHSIGHAIDRIEKKRNARPS